MPYLWKADKFDEEYLELIRQRESLSKVYSEQSTGEQTDLSEDREDASN